MRSSTSLFLAILLPNAALAIRFDSALGNIKADGTHARIFVKIREPLDTVSPSSQPSESCSPRASCYSSSSVQAELNVTLRRDLDVQK